MSGYLLDTNVISELANAAPDSNVLNFLSANDDLWIPVVAIYEIEYGLRILSDGRRRRRLESAMSALIERYADRILHLDREAAECAGALCADAKRSGRRLDVSDALIAGAAKARGLTVATRNVKDFDLPGRRRRQPLDRVKAYHAPRAPPAQAGRARERGQELPLSL